MQELYFQQLKNRDVGPLSANQVRQMIRTGQIQSSDKLRVDGEALAYPAREFLAFREEIERISAQESNERRWVCMRSGQANGKGSTSAMCGPYTRKEIVSLLMRNELSANDFVWREGFSTWRPLKSVDQLQLPIPTLPRYLIPWNSGSLDWNGNESTAQLRPVTAPSRSAGAGTSRLADRALDAAIVIACGLFALVAFKLATHAHSARPRTVAAPAAATSVNAKPYIAARKPAAALSKNRHVR